MTDSKNGITPGVVVTPEFRLVYPNLFEARAFVRDGKPQGEPKYGLVMLFKPDEIDGMKSTAAGVAKAKWPGRDLKELKFPFKKGDAEAKKREDKGKDGSFYAGTVVIKASSKYQPQVVDMDRKDILDPKRVYSGVYAFAELNFVAYNGVGGGQDGVTCYVNFVMISRKGDRIAGKTADDVFSGVQGGDTNVDPTGDDTDDDIPF